MINLDFKMIKSRVFVSSIMNDICHTEPKAKYLNLSFIKKYILVFFKSRSAETSSAIAYYRRLVLSLKAEVS